MILMNTSTLKLSRAVDLTITPPELSASDDDLVARIRAGESEIFEVLMARHRRSVSRAIYGIVRNPTEVEDALQDTFTRAFAKLEQYRGGGRFGSWLTRIAVHEALGRKRVERRLPLEFCADDTIVAVSAELPAQQGFDPEHNSLNKELVTQLKYAIEALPEHFHDVFHLLAIDGLSLLEAAARLGIPPETVKTRFHRAKRRLQEQLRDFMPENLVPATPRFSQSPLTHAAA